MTQADMEILAALEKKALWLSTWMIHNANHLRPSHDGLKVGGHQASSASLATLMTALYFQILQPQDRVAVKPHASPIFHAIQYLFGNQTLGQIQNFRAYGGAQSYPSRTKDKDDVDFSTGSVGLGAAQTLFASLVQDYIKARGWADQWPEGKMVALIGDAELDEGNIYEALLEGWKHGLRNTWWVIDYNRQSLDAVVREGLWARHETMFRNFGWDVVVLKHGKLQQQAFAEPGGDKLKAWIDQCSNQLYCSLVFRGGAAWRQQLINDLGDQGDVSRLIDSRSDAELEALMNNLGGHDLSSILEAFAEARRHDRPVCFIAYTIKGFGLPLAGHKDNHAGLLTSAQIDVLKKAMAIRETHEWDLYEGLAHPPAKLASFIKAAPFNSKGRRRFQADPVAADGPFDIPAKGLMSTQQSFGVIMHEIAKTDSALARRIVTTAPDVTVSTNLGAWVNRRGLFAKQDLADIFKAHAIPSTYNWSFSPGGQHMELGIAEMNLFLMLSALGLSHSIFGERLLPVGTVYDPFIERGLDALNYACYQDARFLLVATPSGITLAPEGGAHQSIATPLIGMAQDGLASFEPAYSDELSVIMRWAFDYMQREGDKEPDPKTWLRDQTGGSVYLRLSTRPLEQPYRKMDAELREQIIGGGYWLKPPGPNPSVILAYQGALAPEVIRAASKLGEKNSDIGILAITSADRLNAGWSAGSSMRRQGETQARSLIERLLAPVANDVPLITVHDGHPATLAWLGAVRGHRTRSLGVEHFGQSASLNDLYRHFGLDADSIVRAVSDFIPNRAF